MEPYCSHDGFFSECYDDMYRKAPKFKDKNSAKLMAGHLAHLKMHGETTAARRFSRTLDYARDNASMHYTLPDNPQKYLTTEEQQWMVSGFIDNRVTSDFLLRQLPPVCTINLIDFDMCLCFVVIRTGSKVSVSAFSRYPQNSLMESRNGNYGIGLDLDRCKHDEKYFSNHLQEFDVDTLSGGIWTSSDFEIDYDGGKLTRYTYDDTVTCDLNEIFGDQQFPPVERCLAAFVALMSRPAEEIHVEADPNFVPKPLTKKQRKQGKAEHKRPTKIRLYVPKRKFITDGLPNVGEGSGNGSRQIEHRRQGHWRTYRSGKRVFVDSYVAGDRNLGSNVDQEKIVEVVPRR